MIMGTISISQVGESGAGHQASITRLGVTGGVTAAIIFLICWIGTYIPFSSPTHAYIGLFTTAPPSSLEALGEGAFWSALFGAMSGGLFALAYNIAAPLDRRGK